MRRGGALALSASILGAIVAFSCSGAAMADPGLVWSSPVLIDSEAAHPPGGVQALTCPATSLCVGFDGFGNAVSSRHPGVIGSWRTTRLPPALRALIPVGVSCPSVSLCVGLATTYSGAGRLLISTAPAGGARAWRVDRFPAAIDPTAISCPSAALCVAVE